MDITAYNEGKTKLQKQAYKELLDFIQKNEKEFNIYANRKDVFEIINIIVNWYKIKYPETKINSLIDTYKKRYQYFIPKKEGSYYKDDTHTLESLSYNMNYFELMLRIPKHLRAIIECWYKGEKEDDNIEFTNLIKIYKHDEDNENIAFIINRIDGSFDGNYTNYDKFIENIISKNNYHKMKELIADKIWKENYNYLPINIENLKKIEQTHELDLELRENLFMVIVLKLLFSNNNIEVGYIRAKRFLEEFNNNVHGIDLPWEAISTYYPLNIKSGFDRITDNGSLLTTLKTPIFMNGFLDGINVDKESFRKRVTYVLNDLSKNDSIENFGLSFETLIKLKRLNVNKLSDIANIRMESVEISNCPFEDQCIIKNMKKKVEDEHRERLQEAMRETIINSVNEKHNQNNNYKDKTKSKSLKKLFKKNR